MAGLQVTPPPLLASTAPEELFRNPPPPPLIAFDGGAPVWSEHDGADVRPSPTDFVRHVYLLHQQPPGFDRESHHGAANTSSRTVHEPERLVLAEQTARAVYPPNKGWTDSLGAVHVLEFWHNPVEAAQGLNGSQTGQGAGRVPSPNPSPAEPPHITLYNCINSLDAEAVPDTESTVRSTDITIQKWLEKAPPFSAKNRFKPEISLRATFAPERFRLMLSLPHLTFGINEDPAAKNFTLEQYRKNIGLVRSQALLPPPVKNSTAPNGNAPGSGSARGSVHGGIPEDAAQQGQISVHQSMFMVINSDMIMLSRTAPNEQSSALPFFPYQCRVGAVHLLVHMIATALQFSNVVVLDHLREISLTLQDRIQMHISRNLYDIKDEVLQTHMKEGVDIGETLAYYIADLCAIQHLVRAQLEALTELAGIFANNALDASKGYNQNIVRLPLRLQEAQHNRIVTDALKMVIDERKAFADHVLPLLGEARKTQQYLGGRHMHLAAEKHAAHAKMSAESMSLFTIVTTVFLPLTFFTSYFALNPAEAIVKTEFDFWKYSGPPTVVFALFTLYIVLFKKYKSGEYTEDRKVVQWLKSIFKWTHSSEPQADPEMALQGSGALRGEGTMEFETQDGGVGGRRSLRG